MCILYLVEVQGSLREKLRPGFRGVSLWSRMEYLPMINRSYYNPQMPGTRFTFGDTSNLTRRPFGTTTPLSSGHFLDCYKRCWKR